MDIYGRVSTICLDAFVEMLAEFQRESAESAFSLEELGTAVLGMDPVDDNRGIGIDEMNLIEEMCKEDPPDFYDE